MHSRSTLLHIFWVCPRLHFICSYVLKVKREVPLAALHGSYTNVMSVNVYTFFVGLFLIFVFSSCSPWSLVGMSRSNLHGVIFTGTSPTRGSSTWGTSSTFPLRLFLPLCAARPDPRPQGRGPRVGHQYTTFIQNRVVIIQDLLCSCHINVGVFVIVEKNGQILKTSMHFCFYEVSEDEKSIKRLTVEWKCHPMYKVKIDAILDVDKSSRTHQKRTHSISVTPLCYTRCI